MIGGIVIVFTDKVAYSSSDVETTHPHSYGGDILAILASLGYGVGDACAEFWSKHVDREEYLGMIGLFGSITTLAACIAYERNTVLEAFTADSETIIQTLGVVLWYIASLVAYYVFESLFLMKSDATLLTLSLQTSNVWAILFSIVVFRETPDPHFYVSIFMVISGVFVYEHYGNDTSKQLETANDCILNESSSFNGVNRPDRAQYYTVNTS
jgi:solute carrier family 35 protein F1/2